MCNEYPRVRLDRVRRPTKIVWDGPPTLPEEPEDSDTSCPMEIALNTTMYSEIGKWMQFKFFWNIQLKVTNNTLRKWFLEIKDQKLIINQFI